MKSLEIFFGFRFIVFNLLLLATPAFTQTAESLKGRIQEHYHGINSGEGEEVLSHHRDDFTVFPANGGVLWEPDWQETRERMGLSTGMGDYGLAMHHFSAQIIGNVGIATFYLKGHRGEEQGTWRVTAV